MIGAVTTPTAAVANGAATGDVTVGDAEAVRPTAVADGVDAGSVWNTVNVVSVEDGSKAGNDSKDVVGSEAAPTPAVVPVINPGVEVSAGVKVGVEFKVGLADTRHADDDADAARDVARGAAVDEVRDGARTRHREREREPDRDFVQFFRDLNITDSTKVPFLAGLLRNFRDAAAKLDSHLSVYLELVHTAVSRMITSLSPFEMPQPLWIRVHDRLGFFHDDEEQKRFVNIGLAYAYRHLEMDALAVPNAKVLKDISRETGIVVADALCEDAGRVGGDAVVAFNTGSMGKKAATHGMPVANLGAAEPPPVVDEDLLANTDGRAPRPSADPNVADGLSGLAGNGGGGDEEAAISDSSDEADLHVPPLAPRTANDGDGTASDAVEGASGKDGAGMAARPTEGAARPAAEAVTRPRLVFARQPVLKPTAPALTTVLRSLSALRGCENAKDA